MASKKDSANLSPGELAEALWKAVNEDNIQKVKDLLEKRADSNNKVYWSEAWLSKNNEPSLKRAPPLHVACWKGNLEIVKALVASGADKDLGDSNNMSPLHYVAEGAHIVVAKYMVEEASCNVVDVKDKKGCSPLDIALKGLSEVDDAIDAKDGGYVDVGVYLLSLEGDVSTENKLKLLHKACQLGKLAAVKELIEKCEIDAKGIKTKSGKVLIDKAIDNVYAFTNEEYFDVALYLASSDKDKLAMLLFACCDLGKISWVKELVEKQGVDPRNIKDDKRKSPLHRTLNSLSQYLSERAGCVEVALYLLSLACGDDKDEIELMWASCELGKVDAVKELAEKYRVYIRDLKNRDGLTLLNKTLMNVNGSPVCIDVALYLINRGCGSVEDKTKLLCAACHWGNLGAVKELVEEHKVDFSVVAGRSKASKTPLDIAKVNHHDDVVHYLQTRMLKIVRR